MTAHDVTAQNIDRMAEAATEDVMARLHHIVRAAVTREVGEELADQRYLLDQERERLTRMEQSKLAPRMPSRGLVAAAAKLASASLALENAQYGPGERMAREKQEKAVAELRTAYRQYTADQRMKGF